MNLPSYSVIGVGEVLWDVFPDGPRFGGAPANFACCAQELDRTYVTSSVVSAVGKDSLGENAIRELESRGLNIDGIQQVDRETGQVLVSLDDEKKATYRFIEDPAWDYLEWDERLEAKASSASALCFGTLGQRATTSRKTIRQFVAAAPESCLKVLDLNFRPPFDSPDVIFKSLSLANALKLNEEELPKVASILDLSGNRREQLEQLKHRFQYRFVALTLGAEGALLMADEFYEQKAPKIHVVDTVGAGDAFTAALVVGTLHKKPWCETLGWANRVAGFVASQPGATPALPKELCFSK